jgi:hypothetical protein
MADFLTFSCPSCGHKLQITDDIDRFDNAACRNEHIVNRNGGNATLKSLIDGISLVLLSTFGTNIAGINIKGYKACYDSRLDS